LGNKHLEYRVYRRHDIFLATEVYASSQESRPYFKWRHSFSLVAENLAAKLGDSKGVKFFFDVPEGPACILYHFGSCEDNAFQLKDPLIDAFTLRFKLRQFFAGMVDYVFPILSHNESLK